MESQLPISDYGQECLLHYSCSVFCSDQHKSISPSFWFSLVPVTDTGHLIGQPWLLHIVPWSGPRVGGSPESRYKLISNIITGTGINHGAPGASGLLVEINEVINIRHLKASRLLSSSSNIIIIPGEFAIISRGRDAQSSTESCNPGLTPN